jgi:hypothetical protein
MSRIVATDPGALPARLISGTAMRLACSRPISAFASGSSAAPVKRRRNSSCVRLVPVTSTRRIFADVPGAEAITRSSSTTSAAEAENDIRATSSTLAVADSVFDRRRKDSSQI